jgi:hypothetical protein
VGGDSAELWDLRGSPGRAFHCSDFFSERRNSLKITFPLFISFDFLYYITYPPSIRYSPVLQEQLIPLKIFDIYENK